MINIDSRQTISLNGKWSVIIDPTGTGDWRQVWKEQKPQKKSDFFEYSFDGGPTLEVPGDFNSQAPELTYYEGIVWYKTAFRNPSHTGKRTFLHFGAVNYLTHVYLNGELLGSHEGGFTPFQFEITNQLKAGTNSLIVKVNNQRLKNGIPGTGYDWLNYGGITRDVNIVETGPVFIEDYHIQLKKHSQNLVSGWVKLNGARHAQTVTIRIPEIGLDYTTTSDMTGMAKVEFSSTLELWSPDSPKLYKVVVQSGTDSVEDAIGFRSISIDRGKILLNGKDVFLRGINIHEENSLESRRAHSPEDAELLLSWAQELNVNIVRLAHYPHNEYMVRLADKLGLMVWSELPVYQHIEFSDPEVEGKMRLMMKEMLRRDRNRASVVIWSLSNETYSFTDNRNSALGELTQECRSLDPTRLITHVTNSQGYENNTFNIWDPLYAYSDIIALNEYIGWYLPWQGPPEKTQWTNPFSAKPVVISEFGGEALYGSNYGPKDEAAFWSEEYQETIYKNQIRMFGSMPNLQGVFPWLLVDYRSPGRLHPIYQSGYNRKGLLSEKGEKKKAWKITHEYFTSKANSEGR